MNIFPYAAPLAVHAPLLGEVGFVHTRTHLVCITRTAHPGLRLAARQAGLKVIAYLDGVFGNCAGYGLYLLKHSVEDAGGLRVDACLESRCKAAVGSGVAVAGMHSTGRAAHHAAGRHARIIKLAFGH